MAKSSDQKRASGAKNRRSAKSKKTKKTENKRAVAIGICMAAVFAVLMFLGNIGMGGMVGGTISKVMFGVFGLMAYFMPFILLGTVFYVVVSPQKPDSKLLTGLFFIILVCAVIELSVHAKPLSPVDVFYSGWNRKSGGGFAGGVIALVLSRAFGRVGGFVVVGASAVICLLFLGDALPFEQQISERMNAPKDKKREKQKKDLAREHRIEREHRAREREAVRESRRRRKVTEKENRREHEKNLMKAQSRGGPVRGVAMDTLIGTKEEQEQLQKSFEKPPTADVSEIKSPGEAVREKPDKADVADVADSSDVTEVSSVELKADEPPVDIPPENDPSTDPLPFEVERTLKPITTPKDMDIMPEPTPVFSIPVDDIEEEPKPPAEPEISKPKKQKPKPEPKPEPVKPTESSDDSGKAYNFPPVDLLNKPPAKAKGKSDLKETSEKLENTLKNFGIDAKITDATEGPTVTRYELQPPTGVKVSKIVNLADDIKLNLAAADIRIEAPIPGKAAVGIEVPNASATPVYFRELVESPAFRQNDSRIAFSAGKDIGGSVIISDIAKMPHVLIAGATGAGKSVCINTIIMSILYRAKPDEVKLIMIDPKVVELSVYNGIPHLLIPVVTDPKKAAGALNWVVNEMMERYEKFANASVRDMKGYNSLIHNGMITVSDGTTSTEVAAEKMPQLVVIVDELADLMMVASKEVEEAICRIAQLARAAGIHLVIATQRPSVNVITGLIKANMPSRIAFAVTSGVDSRTILDMTGAEKLLGKGDMLYYPQGNAKPLRVQGAFVSDDEVKKVTDYIRANNEVERDDLELEEKIKSAESAIAISSSEDSSDSDRDKYFEEAARLLIDKEKGSIGMLQRYFKIGFNRAARIMDQLEEAGVVGPELGTKPRQVIMTEEEFNSL